jgi:sortase (surface protein transpeptidase)
MRGGRRNLAVTVAAGLLAVTGTAVIAMAVAAQRHAPQPPPSAAGSVRPSAVSTTPAIPSSPTRGPKVVGPVLSSSKPVAIDIPAIGVHSSMQFVGLTPQHTLQVPAPGPHYNEAAWYKYSSTPGALGPAVIVGHVDSAAQGPSVFFNLGDLRQGDRVMVSRADGLVAVFRVDGVRRYPKNQFPTNLVYGKTDHAALRLITCGGPFDFATGHYTDNIVVFASLVGSH